METATSAAATASAASPGPSTPEQEGGRRREVGLEERVAVPGDGGHDPQPRGPRRRDRLAERGRLARGSRKALPIDPRSAFHPNGSALAPQKIAPVAPPGLGRAHDRADVAGVLHVHPPPAPAAGARRRARDRLVAGRAAMATMPEGVETGLIASMTARAAVRVSMPARARASRTRAPSPVSASPSPTTAVSTDDAALQRLVQQVQAVEQQARALVLAARDRAAGGDERVMAAGEVSHGGGADADQHSRLC